MDLPQELEFRSVKKQTPVIVSKESRQITAQNGTRFEQGSSGQTQIVFRIPNDENVSVDLSTMWITGEFFVENLDTTADSGFTANRVNNLNAEALDALTTAGAAGTTIPILTTSDSFESMISRVHILVNGSELERFDYYQYGETICNAHTNNANFSNSIGAGCMGINVDPLEKHISLIVSSANVARTSSNTVQFSIPLRWTGVANLRSLVPTYMLGGGQSAIEIRIFLESALNFLCSGLLTRGAATANRRDYTTFTALAQPNIQYVLNNVRMNYDAVYTSDAYSSGLRDYLASNQLQLPIDTYYQTQFNISGTQTSWINQTISTQFSDISAVYVAFFKSNEQNNLLYNGSDRMWFPTGLDEARLIINGRPYPAIPIKFGNSQSGLNGAEAYQYLMKSLKQNCSLEVIGNTNAYQEPTRFYNVNDDAAAVAATTAYPVSLNVGSGYYYSKNRVGLNGANAPTVTNGMSTLLANKAVHWTSPSNFVLGWSVAKSDYSNEFEMSGADLSKSSGLIQVQLKFDTAMGAGNDMTAVVLIKHKRILEIGLDSSQVIY